MAADTQIVSQLSIDPVVNEAMKRFQWCAEWEANARERMMNDAKFAEGDSDNGFQWPNAIRRARDVDQKPCLTLNVCKQHNLQIINELKKNRSGMKFQAAGGGATAESAEMFAAVGRHIEYISNAPQAVYPIGAEWQIRAGIGWWRLVTDYIDDKTFDQEIFIRPVNDPLSVYMDPDIKQRDGSDARFAFVFDIVPKDMMEEAYPDVEYMDSTQPLGVDSGDVDWLMKDHVRVVEYFRKVNKRDRLISFIGTDGQRHTLAESMMKFSPEEKSSIISATLTKVREIETPTIEWYLIIGEKVIDHTIWPGKYIPLIRCIGEESTLEGILDRKGHTRTMKDAQRMYNYNASAQVENVALQSKTPWLAPAKAIEEYEDYWGTANTVNHAVLPYNHIDDAGGPIPPPQRQDPPQASSGYQMGMETAFNQMMMVSGQWQNQMGMMGNERTGAAIERRQLQGDTATYHFADNYALAIRFTALQLVDLIPKIYDTRRVLLCYAEDGQDFELEINPQAAQAYQQRLNYNGDVVRRIFNPNIGYYDVMGGVGPAYGTRREQTVDALTMILTQAPQLTPIIGDLLLSSMDFNYADKAAQRLKRMVPPAALGEGPSPQEQQLQQQLTVLQAELTKSLENHAKDKIKILGKEELRDIEVYRAETDRIKALSGSGAEKFSPLTEQVNKSAGKISLQPIVDKNKEIISPLTNNPLLKG